MKTIKIKFYNYKPSQRWINHLKGLKDTKGNLLTLDLTKTSMKKAMIYLFISLLALLMLIGYINIPTTHANESIEEKAFEFIIKYEGYSDKPYWDHGQWSCGYGMRCSQYTTGITREKSKGFVIERIKHIRKRYDLYKYDDNMEIALISFVYNIGRLPYGFNRYIRNGYINALKNQIKRYVYGGGKRLGGLVKRRNDECDLF